MGFRQIVKRVFGTHLSNATYHPVARVILRAMDIPGLLMFRETRNLPPNYLRCRVGVSGRLFGNEIMYFQHGKNMWYYLLGSGIVNFSSNIVEIGPGCGRRTHHMRDFQFHGVKYTGQYTGIDIDAELIKWCQGNFDRDRFAFHQSTQESTAYENTTASEEDYRFPLEDDTQDLVFATSVITHTLEHHTRNYFREAARVLKTGGHMAITCKCIDLGSNDRGNAYLHRVGEAYVVDPGKPEAAVAYTSDFMRQMALEAGFSHAEILHVDTDIQHTLIARV